MSFNHTLERLREAAKEVPANDKQRGLRENRLVLQKDLRDLLHHFEQADAAAREYHAEIQRLRKINETLEGMKRGN